MRLQCFIICCLLFSGLTPFVNAKIVFKSRDPQGNDDIYVIDDLGNNLRQLTNYPLDDIDPHWSPDGKQIAFVRVMDKETKTTDIILMDADGSNERRLTTHPSYDGPNIAWSPDGKQIAFVSLRTGDLNIHILHLDSGDVTQLTDGDGSSTEPHWSPDGGRITYRNTHRDRGMVIYIMNADGTKQRPIHQGKLGTLRHHPNWSPDGQHILYKEVETVWVKNQVRRTVTKFMIHDQLTGTQRILREFSTIWRIQDLCWMSNGAAILFSGRKQEGKAHLYRYHIESGSIIALKDNPKLLFSPDWVGGVLGVSPEDKHPTQWGQEKLESQ